jgi:hypothetical protein
MAGFYHDASSHFSIAYAGGVALDWKSEALAEGLACYRRGEFFEAHEHWELVWLELEEPEKSFLQAVIQTTAAFHHFHAGNRVGASSLMRRAVRRMDLCPEEFAGLNVGRLRAELRPWLAALEGGVLLPERIPGIELKTGTKGTREQGTRRK